MGCPPSFFSFFFAEHEAAEKETRPVFPGGYHTVSTACPQWSWWWVVLFEIKVPVQSKYIWFLCHIYQDTVFRKRRKWYEVLLGIFKTQTIGCIPYLNVCRLWLRKTSLAGCFCFWGADFCLNMMSCAIWACCRGCWCLFGLTGGGGSALLRSTAASRRDANDSGHVSLNMEEFQDQALTTPDQSVGPATSMLTFVILHFLIKLIVENRTLPGSLVRTL